MTEQEYFVNYEMLNRERIKAEQLKQEYLANGLAQALIKLQKDYQKQLNGEAEQIENKEE